MERDGMSAVDAQDTIDEACEMLDEYLEDGDLDSAAEICMEYFGLELDYIQELLER